MTQKTAVSAHLVGRAAELDAFDALVAVLGEGRPAAAVVVGEPGIGKTRLLEELAARADADHVVLSGSATELERDLPYGVFLDALDEYLQALDPHRFETLDEDVRIGLASVFPSLHGLAGGRADALLQERYRTHRAVRDLLERLTATRPLVLILDDLHWADAASIDLVGALLRRPPDAAVLLALSVRTRQMQERLAAALERAERAGTLARIDLRALTRADAAELLGGAVDTPTADALYEESGGNPFYIEQLARAREQEGVPGRQSREPVLVGIDVPPGVAAALTEELALLAGVSRRILEGAAVAGDPFDPELAAAAAGLDETLALDAVDDLLRLDLIRPTDVPRRFRFRHPLVRRAIYEAAPAGWRLGAHERAAGALAVRGASAEERAHHVERAGRQGETEAISVLREAGSTAAHRAPASAAQWLAAAIRLLPSDFPPGERVELMLACAEAQARSGRLEAGHMTLVRALETVPEGSVALHVRVTNACAGLEHLLGHHERAHKRLETALAEVADQHSPDTVALMIELVLDALYRSAFQEMRSWAERAVAAEIHDLPLRAAALAVRAMAAAMGASADEARICCDEAAKAVDALSDAEIATRLNALAHLATAEVYTERFVLSIRHAERALRVGRATGQVDLTPLITPNLSCAYWVQGRMAEAADLLDGAVESERMLGNTQGLVWKLYNRSFAAFAAGDIDLALATANESFELAKQVDESIITGHAAWMVAQAVLETGQADEAAYLLLSASGGEEQTVIPGAWRAAALELLTRALVTAGRRDEARRSAAAAAAWASSIGLSMAAALARLAEATIELDDGNATGAARLALEAAATFEEIGNRYHAALSRRFAGRALVQAGAPDEAAAELERAARAFESFGAHRYHSELEQELRKLGRTIHHRSAAPTSDSGLDSLTARERELARLVVDRKTNPEIARELFLSPKTVETHLRNIFRKLGVANRVELARAVEQHERAAPR